MLQARHPHGRRHFPPRFARAGRPGAYLRIIHHGEVAAGDPIVVTDRPDHGVTVGLVAHAYHDDHTLAARLLDAPSSVPAGPSGRGATSRERHAAGGEVAAGARRADRIDQTGPAWG